MTVDASKLKRKTVLFNYLQQHYEQKDGSCQGVLQVTDDTKRQSSEMQPAI